MGQVVKYAGSIRKAFAIVAGIILTAVVENVLYAKALTARLWIALPMVVVALYMYTMYPRPRPLKQESKKQ